MPAAADEGAGGAGAVRHPCAHIYSSLCYRGKAYLSQPNKAVHKVQVLNVQNVHRMHCQSLEKDHRKAICLSIACLFYWQLSNLPGDIALFVFRLTGFPLQENVKYYLSHCGDRLNCACKESGPCTMIPLHNLGYSSILFVDLPCIYNSPYEVIYKL